MTSASTCVRVLLGVGASAALGVASAAPAAAVSLDLVVDGQPWRLETVTTSYVASSSLFQTPANGGSMPWFGDGSGALATAFANALLAADPTQSVFGYPNPGTGGVAGLRSPFFAWNHEPANNRVSYVSLELPTPSVTNPSFFVGQPARRDYFIASRVVPGPLPLFGAAAAFGWSRRLRRRISG